MRIAPYHVATALVCSMLLIGGCKSPSSTGGGDSGGSSSGTVAAAESADDWWVEEHHEGRIFVIGNQDTYESFKKSGHLPYTRTKIGKGPRGETLVFEVDKDNPALTDWLEEVYRIEHMNDPAPFYKATVHDGRIYVIGKADTWASFQKSPHLPYTRTKLKAGPNRETVVFEVDKKDPGLVEYLEKQFSRRGLR